VSETIFFYIKPDGTYIEVWFNPPIDPTIVDIMMILSVKVLISIRYDININGAAICTVINSAQFSHLNASITPGNHQWKGAATLFNRRWVQMITGVCEFLSNVNRSSVNVFVTTKSSSAAEGSTRTMKYFNEASVLYIFLTFDIRGMNDIRVISRPIHAPSHALEDIDTNTLPTKLVSKRILVELLGIREESVILYLWGMNPLAYFNLLFYVETYLLHRGVWCMVAFDA
jgi:hypothetical protein